MTAAAALAGTVLVYLAAERVDRRVRRPWTNPVAITVAVLVAWVALTPTTLEAYERGTLPLIWLLRPAVVALGWLVYRQRHELSRLLVPLLAGSGAGSLVSLVAAPLLSRAFGADPTLQHALALKSVTSAVGVDLAGRLGADASLAVPLIIATGIVGAAVGPWFLRAVGVRSPEVIGLAVGTNSHGIGTAAVAAGEGAAAAAASGVAMAATAVLTALAAPTVLRLLGLA